MKGILFRPDMIKAIREGRKTQTRRLSGLKEINKEPDKWENMPIITDSWTPSLWNFYKHNSFNEAIEVKPRYQVGDIVYIKEAWAAESKFNDCKPADIPRDSHTFYKGDLDMAFVGKWRSPLFLKAKDARYFITILAVRPERLQEITSAEAIKEGITLTNWKISPLDYKIDPRDYFISLWDSINPKQKWETNPFVWVYTFERELPK